MKRPNLLKNLAAPAQKLFRPTLMISLMLHGVVFMLPIQSDLDKPPKKEKQIKITQLPTTRLSPKPSPQPSAKRNPQPNLQSSQSTRPNQPTEPKVSSEPNPQRSFQISESTRPKPKEQSANPIISQTQPKPNPSSQTNNSQLDSGSSESSKSKPSQSQPSNPTPNSGSNTGTGTNTGIGTNTGTGTDADEAKVKDPLEDFLKNFPFPENANVGSLSVLSEDADKSARNVKQPLDQVIKYYGKELPARKYTPLASPVADDADLKIYQVSKGSVSQYLHLIYKGENTVIFLSEKKLARENLANLDAESAEEREFKDILRQSVAVAPTKELSSDIKNKLAGGKYNDFGILVGKTPAQLGSEFSSTLSKKGFNVGSQPIDLKQNGLIYSVQKNNFKGFIQLIPTEDGLGTAIISLDDFKYF